MSEFTFSVKSKDIEALRAAFDSAQATMPRGCSIAIRENLAGHGMTGAELILSIAISIGTGIPAGVIANWIFDKIKIAKGSRAFDAEGRLLASIEELQQKIEALKLPDEGK